MMFLTDAETSNAYSVKEALFWYSVLFVVIIIFIIYLKFAKKFKNEYSKVQIKLGREITRLEMICKNLKDNKKLDTLKRTQFILVTVSSSLQKIKDDTNLSDTNDALKIIEEVNKKIKNIDYESKDTYLRCLNDIIEDLTALNSTFITIIQIIKK